MIVLKVLQIISPIFILIFIGFLCRWQGLIKTESGKDLNKFIFYVSLPALLLSKISQAEIKIHEQWGGYLAIIMATVLISLIAIFFSKFFGLSQYQKWVCAHGSIRSNMAFIGLPIIFYASGEKAISVAALLMGMTVPFYNVIGVIFLTLGKRREESLKLGGVLKQIFMSIIKNPLIWGCLAGGMLYFFEVDKSNFILKNIDLIGSISLPLSLICLGIQMNTAITWQRLKQVFFPTFLKLVLCPLAGLLVLHLVYDMPDQNLILAVMILLGCPSAVASYVMAVEMKADHEFAADMVLSTTLLSFLSISAILIAFQDVLV